MLRKATILALIFGLILAPVLVQANAAPTSGKAGPGYHPVPLKSETISVVQELLVFDFRQLGMNWVSPRPARASATYWLLNQGAETETVSVAFPYVGWMLWGDNDLSDDLIDSHLITISLDGEPLALEVQKIPKYNLDEGNGKFYVHGEEVSEPTIAELLEAIEQSYEVHHNSQGVHLIFFEITLEPAEIHQLELAFPQGMTWNRSLFSASYQCFYFLEPASYWKDFSNLTIQVYLPDKFKLESDPPLINITLDDDTFVWQGEFESLPEQNLTISLKPRFPLSLRYGTWRSQIPIILIFYGSISLFVFGAVAVMVILVKHFKKARSATGTAPKYQPPQPPHNYPRGF